MPNIRPISDLRNKANEISERNGSKTVMQIDCRRSLFKKGITLILTSNKLLDILKEQKQIEMR
ncbi:hypothetical protein JCM17380_45450 [Desulfosporosinus burensis]